MQLCRQGALEGKMKEIIRRPLFLLVFLFSLVSPGRATAEGGTVVRVNPRQVDLQAGQTVAIEIRVEDVTDLFGFAIEVHFDPLKISADHAELGDFLEPGFMIIDNIDNINGIITYDMTQSGQDTPSKSGSGVLMTFEISLLEEVSKTALMIDDILLTDRDGVEIPCKVEHGTVKTPGYWAITFLPLVLR